MCIRDSNQAFHQIPLSEESKRLTTFAVPFNLYQFTRVPFGISQGSSVCSRLLEKLLHDIKFKYVYHYQMCIRDREIEHYLQKLYISPVQSPTLEHPPTSSNPESPTVSKIQLSPEQLPSRKLNTDVYKRQIPLRVCQLLTNKQTF